MKTLYLHQHPEFAELIQIVSQERAVTPVLVEKDYWIMHCLYYLQKLELTFQMKGGTSLSKGFKIINRFSEDIDILIEPPEGILVYKGHNQNSNTQITTRKNYYDWLASFIHIDGVYELMGFMKLREIIILMTVIIVVEAFVFFIPQSKTIFLLILKRVSSLR
jgi:hypothetical protein